MAQLTSGTTFLLYGQTGAAQTLPMDVTPPVLDYAPLSGSSTLQNTVMLLCVGKIVAFDAVNKRMSRLAANIPFIKANLSPLSFTNVPRTSYTDAILGVYELNKVDLLKDVYIWTYERSAEYDAVVRQPLGEQDPFRQRHREALRQLVGNVVRRRMSRKEASAHIAEWVRSNVETYALEIFRETAESDLLGLHEGNFARLQVRPSEFAAWQVAWENKKPIFPAQVERKNPGADSG